LINNVADMRLLHVELRNKDVLLRAEMRNVTYTSAQICQDTCSISWTPYWNTILNLYSQILEEVKGI